MKLYKVDTGFYGDVVKLTVYEVDEKPKTFITTSQRWTTRFKKSDLDRIINSKILFTNEADITKNKIRLIDFKILSAEKQMQSARERINILKTNISEYRKLGIKIQNGEVANDK